MWLVLLLRLAPPVAVAARVSASRGTCGMSRVPPLDGGGLAAGARRRTTAGRPGSQQQPDAGGGGRVDDQRQHRRRHDVHRPNSSTATMHNATHNARNTAANTATLTTTAQPGHRTASSPRHQPALSREQQAFGPIRLRRLRHGRWRQDRGTHALPARTGRAALRVLVLCVLDLVGGACPGFVCAEAGDGLRGVMPTLLPAPGTWMASMGQPRAVASLRVSPGLTPCLPPSMLVTVVSARSHRRASSR